MIKKIILYLLTTIIVVASPVIAQTRPDWLDVKGKSFIDVREYQAKGNGITDDTAAIQAALDAVGTKKAVLICGGTFISGTLKPKSGTYIFGDGIIKHNKNETSEFCNVFDLSNTENVTIIGLTLDGLGHERTRTAGTSPTLITGDTVVGARFLNLSFKNALTTAVEMSRVDDLLIQGCSILNTQEHGIYISTRSKNIKVLDCSFQNVGTYPGLTTPQPCVRGRLNVSNVLVSGCSYSNNVPELLPVGAAILARFAEFSDQGAGSIASEPCHNITITNNTATDLTEGVFVSNPFTEVTATNTIVNLVMSGNTFAAKVFGSTYGVVLGKVTGAKIHGNFLSGFNYGIYAGGYNDLSVAGNTIKGPDNHADSVDGISLRHTTYNGTTAGMVSRNAKIINNNVSGYKRYSLFMQHIASEVIISQNNFYSALNRALQVEPLDGVASSDTTGSASYWITENHLQTGSNTAQVFYLNAAPNIAVKALFKNNVVVNIPGTSETFAVFNGAENYDISGNLWSGGSQPFRVAPEATAYIIDNSGSFSIEALAVNTAPGSGTVTLGPNNLPGSRQLYGLSSPPATGSFSVGDQAYNIEATGSANIGWVCTEAGSPGVWKAFGDITP